LENFKIFFLGYLFQRICDLLMSRVFVRIYTHPALPSEANAFCVGDEIGGLTDRLTSIIVQESTTWEKLRSIIEFENRNGMCKKTACNLELRYIMRNACNPHGYSNADLLSYEFATVDTGESVSDNKEMASNVIPDLLSPKVETELVGEALSGLDLVLVPRTQIRPQDKKLTSEQWPMKSDVV
jgi:hypothetical protein